MLNIFVLVRTMVSLFTIVLWASVVCFLVYHWRGAYGEVTWESGCGLSSISAILVLAVTIFASE